jgi:hypothetical protein
VLYASFMLDEIRQPLPAEPAIETNMRLGRTLGEDEFKAKLEMTRAFCDTAKSYVQIATAGLAVPLLLKQAVLGKDTGFSGWVPWSLRITWALFLISIFCGLLYQWLSMRRLWDQYHAGNRTLDNMKEPGYRLTRFLPQTVGFNLSYAWLGMTLGLFGGALSFVIYAWGIIAPLK